MAEGPSRRVHGRGWILSGVLHLQILTLTRNIRTIKRIPLSNTLERGEEKEEKRRVEERVEENERDGGGRREGKEGESYGVIC